MQLYSLSLLFAGLCLVSSVEADTKLIGHMDPLPDELLTQPIDLPHCAGVRVIEWRPFPENSKAQINILDRVCKKAVETFPDFITKEGITIKNQNPFYWQVVMIPYDDQYRDLNDMDFRFHYRANWLNQDGSPKWIPGYTQHNIRDIFIFNIVLDEKQQPNDRFITIFSHELFHAMSYHYGIYQSHLGDKNITDEKLAVRFTEFLGLGH